MNDRIHDDEPDTGEATVRALLRAECPQWSAAELTRLSTSGTDNAMWRVGTTEGPDLVVRLPLRPGSAAGVEREVAALERIGTSPVAALVATPTVRHVGSPAAAFPHHWTVLEWIDGDDAWDRRHDIDEEDQRRLAERLAQVVEAIRLVAIDGLRERQAGERGGPLEPLIESLDRWIDSAERQAPDLVDVRTARRRADEARELIGVRAPVTCVHGDLIPGNLLVRDVSLSAVIDWGGAGVGDPAQDLAPAWSVLSGAGTDHFRSRLGVDEAAWLRGRTFELEHAIGGVLYYVPREHPLGDVMRRTLTRILTEA